MMRATWAIARREFAAYFATPVALVFIVVFLMLSGVLTFTLGGFFARGQADLLPFFGFVPWLFLLLVPALTMRLWAEERRSGTIEMLLTLPLAPCRRCWASGSPPGPSACWRWPSHSRSGSR
jgi:ABC-2 type transport system permease protein